MAKKKALKIEEVEETKSAIVDASEVTDAPVVIEVEVKTIESPVDLTEAIVESTPTSKVIVEQSIKEVEYSVYGDEEIVMFRNNRGHLKWGVYKSISNLGYLAIGTYVEYKAGKTF